MRPDEKALLRHRSGCTSVRAPSKCPAATPCGSRRFGRCSPSHEQLGLKGDLGIEPAAPTQPQIAPKNGRLFWILPNYLTIDNRDQSGPLSAKTKFELSAKTNVRSGHDFVHLCDGPYRPGSEQRSILWTGSAGLREALRYILRRHRDWHSYDDLGVTHASASRFYHPRDQRNTKPHGQCLGH